MSSRPHVVLGAAPLQVGRADRRALAHLDPSLARDYDVEVQEELAGAPVQRLVRRAGPITPPPPP